MDNFNPKEATEALLTALAASGDGDGMAKEVRKAGWLATRMNPMQLISAAAKEPKVHQYHDGKHKGAEIIKRMAERHLMMNAGTERLPEYPEDTMETLREDACELLAKAGMDHPTPAEIEAASSVAPSPPPSEELQGLLLDITVHDTIC